MTFFGRCTQFHEADTCIFQDLLHFRFVLVGYLDDDTRIFGKQDLHQIVALDLVQTDFHTSFGIGKAHFQQCSNHTTCRDIVTGQDQSLVDQLLNSQEGIAEVFRILYGRYVAAHLVQ